MHCAKTVIVLEAIVGYSRTLNLPYNQQATSQSRTFTLNVVIMEQPPRILWRPTVAIPDICVIVTRNTLLLCAAQHGHKTEADGRDS